MRCINAFDGCVLFMPNTYNTTSEVSGSLAQYDFQGGLLNIVSYYITVFFSLTGFISLLNKTKIIVQREEGNVPFRAPFRAESCPELVVHSNICQYVQQQFPTTKSTKLYLKRRFEYKFGSLISALMLHVTDDEGKLHMIEVYRVNNAFHRELLRVLFSVSTRAMRFVMQKASKTTSKSYSK